jgi:4-amino-4-deoxy-L-arabinose transferase-like glycosyltransferase
MTLRNGTHFTIIAVLCGIIWFSLLGYRDLFDPDEGRYAEIPAGMVLTGDWVTPRLNGVKYFEKPVFQYWATAAVYTVAGKSNATARIVPALAGFLTALFVAWVALQLYGPAAARFTFLFSISSLMWVAVGHILNLDMLLSSFIVAGIGSLAVAQANREDKTKSRNWMLAGWATLALALLTKGLIGIVLPAGSVLVYSLWQRDWAIWKNLHIIKGLMLFLLIAAPWFIVVSKVNPEFANFFFIHEHWDRYTSAVHNREEPSWYFVPYLILGVMPWLTISLAAMFRPAFSWLPEQPGSFNPTRLLWCFATVTFVFFSMGNSKLPAYILPIIPIIAILAGQRMASRETVGGDRWTLAVFGLIVLGVAFNVNQLANERYTVDMWQQYQPWLLGAGGLLVVGSVVAFINKSKPLLAWSIAAPCALLAIQMMIWGAQSIAEVRSSYRLATVITEFIPEGAPVFSIKTFPKSVPFYLGRTITIVDHTGELAFGIEQEPEKTIPDLEEFLFIWNELDQAAMIIDSDKIEKYFPGLQLGEIVYLGPKRAIIIKQSR